MPASRSRNPSIRPSAPPERRQALWPLFLIGAAAAAAMLIAALPASIIARFLPPAVQAEQFSGSVWHGVAGAIRVGGRDAGALEWRLHPAALLHLALDVDVHWIKSGVSVDANVEIRRGGFTATAIRGGGPIEDLREFGIGAGWRGTTQVALANLSGDFARITSIAGEIRVESLSLPQVADGASLGGYRLRFPADAVGVGGTITAQAADTGGPLQLQASVTVAPNEHRGSASGTVAARPGAAPALVAEIDNLARLRGRDQSGRVPVELEFNF